MHAPPRLRPARRPRDAVRTRPAPWVLLAMLLCAAGRARAEWFYDVRAGGLYDDNLTRAQRAADVRGDGAATVAAAAASFHAPSGGDGIILALAASCEGWSLNLSYAVARTTAYDDLNYLGRIGTMLLAFRY